MESLDTAGCSVDDLLNLDFASDMGEEDDDDDKKSAKRLPSVSTSRSSYENVGEEELEWISNKDAFPAVETLFVDTLPDHHGAAMKHESPVSVLENSNSSTSTSTNGSTVTNGSLVMYCCGSPRVPVKARSKCHRRFRHDLWTKDGWWVHENAKNAAVTNMGRKCQHCGAEKTPQWRAGPLGPKTLCNACGVRYKSGRLCDEYRPASSPTFSSQLHSNSHRKILEMRKQRLQQPLSMLVVKPVDKG
ncbi:hypothetical protein SLE2022_256460 [Rubroshorea leprosula]